MNRDAPEARLALSFALGLLLGLERERRNRERGERSIAGVRTFALVSFLGGLLAYSQLPYAVILGAAVVGSLAIIGYMLDRGGDRGLTTEVALVVAYVIGALSLERPRTSAAAAIVTTLLLAVRTKLHSFVRDVLREEEVHDGLLLLVLAFIVLPLAQDANVGPYGAINPQRIARLVTVVTTVGAFGYVSQRMLGSRYGLAASAFASGFVSSSATIAALGAKAKADPSIRRACVASAIASCVPTVLLYAILVAAIDPRFLGALVAPLGAALLVAVTLVVVLLRRSPTENALDAPRGRAFEWKPALAVGVVATVVSIGSRALESTLGGSGIVVISALAGLVDAHATAGSVATMHHDGGVSSDVARTSILAALSSNSCTKIILARAAGDRRYALATSLGVLAIAIAAWIGAFAVGSLFR